MEDPARAGKEAAYSVTSIKGGLGRSVRTARYRYTEWGDAAEAGVELYDYERDPHEVTNLARDPAHGRTVEELKALLARSRERAGR